MKKRVPTQEKLLMEWIDQAVDVAARHLVELTSGAAGARRFGTRKIGEPLASKLKAKRRKRGTRCHKGCGGW